MLAPSRILEIVFFPPWLDAHISGLLLLADEVLDNLLMQMLFVNLLYHLVVVIVGSLVARHTTFQLDDSHLIAACLAVLHDERLRDLTYLHTGHHSCDLGRKFIHRHTRCTSALAGHHASTVTCVLVARQVTGSLLETELGRIKVHAKGVHAGTCIGKFLGAHLRSEEDMTEVGTIATTFDELDDVIAEFGLDDLRHLARFGKLESYGRELWHISTFGLEA